MIVAFHALAVVVETPLLAWSERVAVRWFCGGALLLVGAASFLAAVATGPVLLGVALALYGPASGCAVASAEGELVERRPEERERTLSRLGIAAGLGDLAVPGLLWLVALLGAGWRTAFAIAGALSLLLAARVLGARSLDHRPLGAAALEEADEGDASGGEVAPPTMREALRTALGAPSLLAWSLAASLTNLLDEVLVAFAAIHLAALGASDGLRSLAIGAWVVGALGTLAIFERLADRVDARRALLASSCTSAAALAWLTVARAPSTAVVALFAVGASAALLHPLAKARSYAALPGRPALVNALASALLPLDMLAPLAIGWASDRTAPAVGVALLGVAPLGILLVALTHRRVGAARATLE